MRVCGTRPDRAVFHPAEHRPFALATDPPRGWCHTPFLLFTYHTLTTHFVRNCEHSAARFRAIVDTMRPVSHPSIDSQTGNADGAYWTPTAPVVYGNVRPMNGPTVHAPDDKPDSLVILCSSYTKRSGFSARLSTDDDGFHHHGFCHGNAQQVVPFSLQPVRHSSGNLVGYMKRTSSPQSTGNQAFKLFRQWNRLDVDFCLTS